MVWYYKVGEQEKGPVSKAELQSLIKSNNLNGKSLVRSVEMEDWQPLIEVIRGKAAVPQSPPPAPPVEDQVDDMVPSPPVAEDATAVCSQCGRFFPQDQVIAFEDKLICAACKPMFVQKLKEGAVISTDQNYAGFWIRVLAKLIDGIVLGISQWAVMMPISMLLMPVMMEGEGEAAVGGVFLVFGLQMLLGLSIQLAYNTFFLGRFGATLGKMACSLKVVTPEGGKITYMRALGRFFGEWVSMVTLYIGYIIVAFDEEKRSLHDRICSTRVVKK